MPQRDKVLVTDFDGTMTRVDFYEVAVEHCLRGEFPDYWGKYARKEMTHFEAMAGIFSHIGCSEEEVRRLLPNMEIDERLGEGVRLLGELGWDVVVVSNGCRWYIDILLAEAGVELEVHSSAGRFVEGKGLVMVAPEESAFFAPGYGIDKRRVVEAMKGRYKRVAFAGNGPPDEGASLLVEAEVRFARAWLAERLEARGERFRRFERWSEVAFALVKSDGASEFTKK